MTKLLEQAIAKARTLSDEEQDALAETLFAHIAGNDVANISIDRTARNAIAEGLAQAERGEFVPDEEIQSLWKRHGV
jgi:predicted transcriptional regulator